MPMTLDEGIANYSGIAEYLSRYYIPDAEVKLSITNAKCIEWFTEIAEWLRELKELKAENVIDDKHDIAYQQGYEDARQETMKLMLSQTKAVAKIQQENAELRHQIREIADQNQKLREAIVRGKEEYYD